MSIKAVVFDLDDTLYPEIDYVKSGFCEVAKEIEKRFSVKNAYKKLLEYFYVDKHDVYSRILHDYGISFKQSDIDYLIEKYRSHFPKLSLSNEVKSTFSTLRARGLKLGIITDGRPYQQHAKIKALGLKQLVDYIIVTDELGGIECRKPNPLAFQKICEQLCVNLNEMVYVGDNPQKDFVIKKYLPIKTVQLITDIGIYENNTYKYGITPDLKMGGIEEILSKLEILN